MIKGFNASYLWMICAAIGVKHFFKPVIIPQYYTQKIHNEKYSPKYGSNGFFSNNKTNYAGLLI